ncbi:signal peptidase I [Bradyrhizobium sp.]|jgi:signal peptidase I|uniref:signal peptidase I n=1 Tax=Bradyrhizobium sp. TaxID=376 RepID=UPI002E0098E3|nr:signal peptidase I [Bradyrhizobium sp.]
MSAKTAPEASTALGLRGQLVQVAAIVAIVFLGKAAVAEPFYVPSPSMEPTLLIGDAMLASKYPYGYGAASLPIHIAFPETGRVFGAMPKRGDVVVFRWPGDRSQAWVKRVVGLPGDRVQMRQGVLYINSQPVALKADGIGQAEDDNGGNEPARRYIETLPGGVSHTIFKTLDQGRLDNTPEVTVPKDRLFVMGDNRDNSADSRVPVAEGGVGLLPSDNLVGRVDAIVGSWDFATKSQPVWTWPSGFRVARFFTSVH